MPHYRIKPSGYRCEVCWQPAGTKPKISFEAGSHDIYWRKHTCMSMSRRLDIGKAKVMDPDRRLSKVKDVSEL
jgi:hypothetical protein